MTIRVKHTVAVLTSRDTQFKKAMWYPDVTLAEVIIDTFEKQASGNFAVPVSSIETLSMGDIDAVRGFYLETETACKIRINGSLDSIDLVPSGSGFSAKLFLEAELDSVIVENESADTILNGVFVFWGDPTA